MENKNYTLQILNELLEEVLDIPFEERPKHLRIIIEEAEELLISKGVRYRIQKDGLNRDL